MYISFLQQHDAGGTPRSSLIFVSCTSGTSDFSRKNAVTTEKRVDGREQEGQTGGWQAKRRAQVAESKMWREEKVWCCSWWISGVGRGAFHPSRREEERQRHEKKIIQPIGHVHWLMKPANLNERLAWDPDFCPPFTPDASGPSSTSESRSSSVSLSNPNAGLWLKKGPMILWVLVTWIEFRDTYESLNAQQPMWLGLLSCNRVGEISSTPHPPSLNFQGK